MRSLLSHNIRRCNIISPSCRHIISNIIHHDIQYNSSFSTAAKDHLVHVRSALSSSTGVLLPYEKGWAWQHVLLHRRLKYMRRMQQQQQQLVVDDITANTKNSKVTQQEEIQQQLQEQHGHNDHDCILLFEHEPVYTLGRGASEDHLTFLNNELDGGVEKRKRLNRKYRGQDASRLNIDSSNSNNNGNNINGILSVEEEVSLLLKQCQCTSTNNNNNTPPVYAPNGSPIYRIERGGEVTYHGPGQLVMYPLLNLKQHQVYQQDLHWYLRQIEQVIIETLSHFNIQSNRDTINTGVWVNEHKIAAVGVSSSRWITTHGFAINVSPNLNAFDKDIMIPCGIDGRGVTSIANVLNNNNDDNTTVCPTVEEVGEVALHCFENVFGVTLVRHDDIIK